MECLPKYVVDKTMNIPIHTNDIQDKIIWKCFLDNEVSVKTNS